MKGPLETSGGGLEGRGVAPEQTATPGLCHTVLSVPRGHGFITVLVYLPLWRERPSVRGGPSAPSTPQAQAVGAGVLGSDPRPASYLPYDLPLKAPGRALPASPSSWGSQAILGVPRLADASTVTWPTSPSVCPDFPVLVKMCVLGFRATLSGMTSS